MKKFGFELLEEQAVSEATDQIRTWISIAQQDYMRAGDSPIERILWASLHLRLTYAEQEWFSTCMNASGDSLERLKTMPDSFRWLILQSQVEIAEIGRVDFLIHAHADWASNPEGGKAGWRKLIIECDGHNFHERTKEQAAKDRSRDRRAVLLGIDVLRFTGSQLWRDPWKCAGEVIAWANRGV